MPYDRRTRRSLSMFAGNMFLLALPLAMGCQRLSVSRMPDVTLPPASPAPAAPAPVRPPAAPAPAPQPVAVPGNGSTPLTQLSSQAAPAIVSSAPLPPAPAPALATPLLDAALQRAKATDAVVVDEPPASMPIMAQNGEIPRFTTATGSATGTAPTPFPNVFLSEALPPVPPAAADSKSDLKVEAATSLVPKGTAAPASPSRPIDPERPADPPKPYDLWREGLDRLRSVARDRAAEAGNDSDDRWTLRAQLLDALGEPDGASGPDDAALRRTVFTALAALTGPDSKSSQAPVLSAKVRVAVEALEERTPLEITELQLCRKVKRFGDYELLEAPACRAGHAVILYCEMAGVHYAPEGGLQRSRLTSRVEIVAPGGSEPVWTQSLGTADDLCRHRRRDFYVNYRITLPDGLAPGSYELRLIQDDLVAGQTTTRAMALLIAP